MEQLKKFLNFIVNLSTGLIVAVIQPMVKIARKHPIAFSFAVVIHIALAVGLYHSDFVRWEMPEKTTGAQQSAPTKAVAIDVEVIKAERQRLADLDQQKQDKLEREIKQSEDAIKAQKHAEEHRKDEEEKAAKAKKLKQQADKERKATEQKAAEAAQKQKQAEAEALEAEKQKQLADEQRKIVEELEAAMSALGEQPRTRSLRRSLAAWGLFLASPVLGLRFALRLCYHAEGRVGRWYHGYSAWLAEHAAPESARTFQRLSLEKRRHAQVLETFVEHAPARWRR